MSSRFQSIYDIAVICARKGLHHAILCPGSRCAPLTLAFARHADIKSRSISDERSAAFIALGLAQQKQQPTILVCTSGTAAYNFAPAVAEAYFSNIPLLVFTADRPAEWIGQQDGQTVYQSGIFGKHVKHSYQLPQEYEHPDDQWAINRIVNEAINLAKQEPAGPVHINAPFREPLYPSADEPFNFSEGVRVISDLQTSFELKEDQKKTIVEEWPLYHNILIVAGQHDADEGLQNALSRLISVSDIPLVGDIISNLHGIGKCVRNADLFLGQCPESMLRTLRPDLLITFGQSTISKNLKLFLRKHQPSAHWHIQPAGGVADTFKSVTRIFRSSSFAFFDYVASFPPVTSFEAQKQNNFGKLWEVEERRSARTLEDFFPQKEFAELELVREVLKNLPARANLHLANSMSVRYANFIGLLPSQNGIKVFANRGTSGIDGCTSTSVGHALASDLPNILITGDLAFFYDRNAFWHNYKIDNLRVVLINNHGGIIFNMIDGPRGVPESEEYFVTRQNLTAVHLCAEFGIEYLKLDHKRKLKNLLADFFQFDGKPKVLEIETEMSINKTIFDSLKQTMKKSYEL